MRRSKFQLGYEFTIPELPGVYVISKKLTDEILYVGKTTNLRRRFGRHLKKTHNFRFNKFMSQTTDELTFRYCIAISDSELRDTERNYIRSLNPLFNDIRYTQHEGGIFNG